MSLNNNTILLVDDEVDILEFLGYNLRKSNYIVLTATSGEDAIKIAIDHLPALIILDIMMPGMDGIETCREIRKIPELQKAIIAMLSARGEEYVQISGFDAGADDYIKKPIRPSVLSSRVKALLRRLVSESERTDERLYFDNIVIDKERYSVFVDDREIYLPRKEFELLFMLTAKPNKVFSREEILEKIWGENVVVGDRTIDVHIRKIREKIGLDNIRTFKGIGYSFQY